MSRENVARRPARCTLPPVQAYRYRAGCVVRAPAQGREDDMKERSRGAKRPSPVGSLLAFTAVLASIPVSAHAATGDSVRGSATLNDGGITTITVLANGAADEQDATGTIAGRRRQVFGGGAR
jgi:hypothetical protein